MMMMMMMAAGEKTMTSHCRHPVADADERNPMGSLTPEDFYLRHAVVHSVSSFLNPQGLRIFTQSWAPSSRPPLGIVCVVHGFTDESGWIIELTAVYFAAAGFRVCALDHQGHGRSEGLAGDVPDVDPLVDDCASFFESQRAELPAGLPAFLYGESLGGAIALLVHLRGGSRPWSGVVVSGAMCGISGGIKPRWPLEHLLACVAALVPRWPVAVTRDNVVRASYKVAWKRRLAEARPRGHTRFPRAATALELLRVCRELQGRFEDIKAPLLVVHGGADRVCSANCAEDLYRRAVSEDKTLRIYPDMWHQLVGEPDHAVDLVFGEIREWLLRRASRAATVVDAPPPVDVPGGGDDRH